MLDLISKSDVLDPDVFDNSDPEQARVQSILDVILDHLSDDQKILYHFGECSGHDDEHYKFVMSDQIAPWHTIYDSCYFPVTDGGSYSIIQVSYSKCGKHFYLALSLGGSLGSSALTEYFKVPLPDQGKWAFSA
tara:strand:- start:3519 stop:3920 length:402 start_codon:yes stop_codon:yes gene_type:complete